MINGLDIYYSKIGRGLKPISNNDKKIIWFWVKTY